MKSHPIQPVIKDEHGTLRFKRNAIVEYLLEQGGIDMNQIASLPFNQEDREQFAQLIGYSLCGASDLSYVRSSVIDAAEAAYNAQTTPEAARVLLLEQKLALVRKRVKKLTTLLFSIHPDDLQE
jgi:glutathione S-transferase